MTRTTTRRRRSDRTQPADRLHLPHWSWTRKDGPPTDATLAPDEFWARLGI